MKAPQSKPRANIRKPVYDVDIRQRVWNVWVSPRFNPAEDNLDIVYLYQDKEGMRIRATLTLTGKGRK